MGTFIKKIFGRDKASKNKKSGLLDNSITSESVDATAHDEAALSHAQLTFDRYNTDKIKFLRELLPSRKKIVYDLIPFFLHTDGLDILKNRDACQMSPHGIFGYEIDEKTEKAYKKAFPGKKMPVYRSRASFDPTLPIKNLTLIGSLGSIAQNAKSDFDYWVCFDAEVFSRESFIYFQEKLEEIEQWAEDFGGAEVHFFPLDMRKVRENDFGQTTGESSGTAQAKLLKEEFYRTMTLVAGQVPLWWVMPPGVTDMEYARLAEIVSRSTRVDGMRLVDMGNAYDISMGEFYGAAIWQINKTMGSPFKSIIKMALLEEYMANHGSKGLLCNELKQRLISDGDEIGYLDPYVLMFERVAAYLSDQSRDQDLDLLRRSMYMKTGAKLTLADYRRTDLPRKKQVMVNLVRRWGWGYKQVEPLNDYHMWTFRMALQFSRETNGFIRRTYNQVSSGISREKERAGLTISQRDLTVLGRKLFIFYSKRTNKVDSILNVIETPPALRGLTLQPYLNKDGKKTWAAYRALLSKDSVVGGAGTSALLRTSPDLTEILIWLVNNQLYDASTSINLNTGNKGLSVHCTVPDIQRLLVALKEFFPPIRQKEMDEDELLQKPRMVKMFLTINLDSLEKVTDIQTTGLCYQNNWGEVFFKGFTGSQDGLKIARDFVRKHFAYDPLGALSNFKIFLPERPFKKRLGPKLQKYFGVKAII